MAIEDEYVRFVAGAAGRAGVRVTLDGAESSDRVTVEAAVLSTLWRCDGDDNRSREYRAP